MEYGKGVGGSFIHYSDGVVKTGAAALSIG